MYRIKIKRIVAVLLSLALIVSLSFTSYAVDFTENTEESTQGIIVVPKVSADDENEIVPTAKLVPQIKALTNVANGIKVEWGKDLTAYSYVVFVKVDDAWKKVATTQDTNCIYTKAVNNTEYTFTLRYKDKRGNYISDYNREGVSIKYYEAPIISSLSIVENGVHIKWNKVDTINAYAVYRKEVGGPKWKKLATVGSNDYTDYYKIESGKNYLYTVRCMKDGNYVSGYHEDKSILYVDMPIISNHTITTTGIKVKWHKIDGISNYCVFVHNGTKWKKAGYSKKSYFTYKDLTDKKVYNFTIRGVDKDKNYISLYDKTGYSVEYYPAPKIGKITINSNNISISWTAIEDISEYRVYRKTTKESNWKILADVSKLTYTDKSVKSGNEYYYAVRCLSSGISSGLSTLVSTYVVPKRATLYNTMPKISSIASVSGGISIKWGAVEGAQKYRVFVRKESKWVSVGNVTTNSFKYTDVNNNNEYRFTVRCITSDEKKYSSVYDKTGAKIKYIKAPKITSLSGKKSNVTIYWKAVKGAYKYKVYYKDLVKTDDKWHTIGSTTDCSYSFDLDKLAGETFYDFTVRCFDENNLAISGYREPGYQHTYGNARIMPYFNQCDYDKVPYGDGTIANCGCGPTSIAMVASYLTKKYITPKDVVSWAGLKYYVYGAGTAWSIFPACADKYGMKLVTTTGSINTVISYMKKGCVAISSQAPGYFTYGGHFIVLKEYTSKGKIIVYDPNGYNGPNRWNLTIDEYTKKKWDPSQVAQSATNYWIFSTK